LKKKCSNVRSHDFRLIKYLIIQIWRIKTKCTDTKNSSIKWIKKFMRYG